MALAAAQVIDAVAARLLTVFPGAVFTDRAWPIASLPAWRVLAGAESVSPMTVHGLQQHDLEVELIGVVRAVDAVDDAMHALASQALTALNNPNPVLGFTLTAIDRALQGEAEAAHGQITLRGLVVFATAPAAPDTLIPLS